MMIGAWASLAAGAVTGGLVFKKKQLIKNAEDEYMEGYNGGLGDAELDAIRQKRDGHVDEAESLALASNILLGLGGAAAAVFVVFISLSAVGKKKIEKKGKTAVLAGPGELYSICDVENEYNVSDCDAGLWCYDGDGDSTCRVITSPGGSCEPDAHWTCEEICTEAGQCIAYCTDPPG